MLGLRAVSPQPRAVSRAGPWGQRDLGKWDTGRAASAGRLRPGTFLPPPRLTVETGSCLWFLFSTSEAESEPLVWSLNKLELKLPQRGNWERCTVCAQAAARGEERRRGGRLLLGDQGGGSRGRGRPAAPQDTEGV